jgi:hypothetical protein
MPKSPQTDPKPKIFVEDQNWDLRLNLVKKCLTLIGFKHRLFSFAHILSTAYDSYVARQF